MKLALLPGMLCLAVASTARAGPAFVLTEPNRSAAAGSDLVTWEFAGEVTFVLDQPGILAEHGIGIGTPFSGSFTFDAATPDSRPDDPGYGYYVDAVSEIEGVVGAMPFLGPRGSIIVFDEGPLTSDSFNVDADVLFFDVQADFGLVLLSSMQALLTSDKLVRDPPSLDLLDFTKFEILNESVEGSWHVVGSITSLVPEPASVALLVAGTLCVLCGSRRSRMRRKGERPRSSSRRTVPPLVITGLLTVTAAAPSIARAAEAILCH